MNGLIAAAFSRERSVVIALILILILGSAAYLAIPRESEPDVPIPLIYISITYDGISPEDAERLLIRPMERELQAIEGLRSIEAIGTEGHASLLLEFDAGFDADTALQDVRDRVDTARAELPPGTDEPRISEINIALFPIISVALAGPVPERTLLTLARDLSDRLEALPGVLEIDIGGEREELMEIIVDPTVMQTYNISFEQLMQMLDRNNLLIPAGAIDTGAGRLSVKVPGVIEDITDVLSLPIKVENDTVVTFDDVAEIRRTFKDPLGFARIDSEPALVLEVSKRLGANIIETVEQVRATVAEFETQVPGSVRVSYLQDRSEDVRVVLRDLQNNVALAVLLVMVVIIGVLGPRAGMLVGIAIPGAFLAGILALYIMGYTLNIVVLFSLILVVGLLVDGVIVVAEFAERRLLEGDRPEQAYRHAAQRMAWPITSSVATTLAVFLPLLFWPGLVGEFMKFLPITVIVTLAASLAMALIFIPVLGAEIAWGPSKASRAQQETLLAADQGELDRIHGFTGFYIKMLDAALKRPALSLLASLVTMGIIYVLFANFNHGVEFFPSIEPEAAQIQVLARGDLSVWEQDALVREVESRLLDMPEFETVYARVGAADTGMFGQAPADQIGAIRVEFIDWQLRRPAARILDEVRQRTADIPGIVVETREMEPGPSAGKPIDLELTSTNPSALAPAVEQVRGIMRELGGFIDVEDTRPLPGIEWGLQVDREAAGRYGADVALLGSAVQMVTGGIMISEYRPDDADDEVEIRVRFPADQRHLDRLTQLRVLTERGQVPIGNFVDFETLPQTGTLRRVDGRRVLSVLAEVDEGLLPNDQIMRLDEALSAADLNGVEYRFRGLLEDQQEAATFLTVAFVVAIALMALFLVTQFNSVYQAALVLSAIIFSTAGVLLGLLITGEPFGIVMSGMGIIALGGIVINNNIILIDTYNELKARGLKPREAVRRTGAQRLRPVLLTAFTTVLGLMPMVIGLNIDLIGRSVSIGAPSSQWWTTLASTIAGGLAFATVLTLVLTPCLLVLGDRAAERLRTAWLRLLGYAKRQRDGSGDTE